MDDDRPPYKLVFHRKVSAIVRQYGVSSTSLRPTLERLFETLRSDPKQYPLKKGKLHACRAAGLRFNKTTAWRRVFDIDEAARTVRVLSLGEHDSAYDEAQRRI